MLFTKKLNKKPYINMLMSISAALVLSSVQVTAHANSEAIASGSEMMSQGSGYIVAGSFITALGSAEGVAEGSEWVVRGIEEGGESVIVTVGNASKAGVEVSFAISKGTAEAIGLAANGVFNLGVVTVEGASQVIGYTLSQGGKVMLYLADKTHDIHASSEKL